MTHLEALREFDTEQWHAAIRQECDSGSIRTNPKTHEWEVEDGKPSLIQLAGKALREQMNETDMEQAIVLWMAGWKSETPSKTQVDVMSWYWRRPPIGKRTVGRLFLSTNQAFNALKRESK